MHVTGGNLVPGLVFALAGLFSVAVFRAKADAKGLNQYCQHVQDCKPYAYFCSGNYTCQCAKNYIPSIYGDRCIGGVKQRCHYDDDCVRGAFCEHQVVCKCKDDTPFPSEDGFECTDSSSTKVVSIFFIAAIVTIGFLVS